MADRKDRLKALIDQNPDDPFPRYGLAMEFRGAGDHMEAAQIFQELLERSPNYLPAYYQLGTTLQVIGQNPEAVRVVQQGIKLATQSGDSHAREELEAVLEELS